MVLAPNGSFSAFFRHLLWRTIPAFCWVCVFTAAIYGFGWLVTRFTTNPGVLLVAVLAVIAIVAFVEAGTPTRGINLWLMPRAATVAMMLSISTGVAAAWVLLPGIVLPLAVALLVAIIVDRAYG